MKETFSFHFRAFLLVEQASFLYFECWDKDLSPRSYKTRAPPLSLSYSPRSFVGFFLFIEPLRPFMGVNLPSKAKNWAQLQSNSLRPIRSNGEGSVTSRWIEWSPLFWLTRTLCLPLIWAWSRIPERKFPVFLICEKMNKEFFIIM